MFGELTRHLWQSTLFALAAGLLTLAFRRNRAQVRYWLWFSASVKFLLPFSVLMSVGSHLGSTPVVHKAAARVTTPVIAFTTEQINREFFVAPGFPGAMPDAPSNPNRVHLVPIGMAVVWACGFAVIALMRLRGWQRIREALQSSALLEIPGFDTNVEIRCSQGRVEPGVVGLWRPIMVLPVGLLENLTAAQLQAVLAHELCHVRRRDNLLASIHMIVEAVFWFHPLVWWIGARLVEERERACDEEVLSQLGEPGIYAEGILNVCRLCVESPLVCVSGVTGGRLKRRIEEIMRNHVGLRLTGLNKVLLASAGVGALALPLLVGVAVRAQSPDNQAGFVFTQPNATTPRFELADVHVSPHTTNPNPFIMLRVHGDRYEVRNANMLKLISTAWNIDPDRVFGGPNWLELDRFDVNARISPETPEQATRLMLQALLVDRFKLELHKDTKPIPAYVVTLGNGRPKLRRSDDSGNTGCRPEQQVSQSGASFQYAMSCRNVTMETLAQTVRGLRDYITIPIVDSTGLEGSWDFDLKWTPRHFLGQAGADAVTIFEAFDKQLGLKLELRKAPEPVLVVNRVNEQPTDNPPEVARGLPAPPPPEFEVAVIKQSMPNAVPWVKVLPGGQVDITGLTLKDLIEFAWGYFNPDEMIAGAPKGWDSTHFDVTAKVSPGALPANTPQVNIEDVRLMLRSLLADRFKLKTHTEDRPVTTYDLIAVKPKLKKADPTNRTGFKEAPGADGKDPRLTNPMLTRLVSCTNMTMTQFADLLQKIAPGYLHSPVMDATGIDGAWEFTIAFSTPGMGQAGPGRSTDGGSQSAGGTPTASDPNGAVSLFDAVYSQLGLKLIEKKRPLPVLVIDHVEEKPTDN